MTLSADSSNRANPSATGSGIGAISFSAANTTVSINDTTATAIGDRSVITAEEKILVEAKMATVALADSDVATLGLLFFDAKTDATMTFDGSTTTTIGGATLLAADVALLAEVTLLKAGAEAHSGAIAPGASSTAISILNVDSSANVIVRGQASITGTERVVIGARHDGLVTNSKAKATTFGALAGTVAEASGTQTTASTVVAEVGSSITTRDLVVEANAPFSPSFSVLAQTSAIFEFGGATESRSFSLTRSIDFNGDVTILSVPSPELVIDANGDVVKQVNISFQESPTEISVDDIKNDNSLPAPPGKITFLLKILSLIFLMLRPWRLSLVLLTMTFLSKVFLPLSTARRLTA